VSLSRTPRYLLVAMLLAGVLALAACGSDDDSGSDTAAGDVTLADCTPDTLETLQSGTLTIATDKPAYPPYFEDDDPTNGKGFESAVGFAIADRLGFAESDVEWVVEPFNSSYAPGPKDFDFDLNQISITEKRAQQVDFSSPYYTADQAVVVRDDAGIDNPQSLADLADLQFGVQIGTTSLDALESIEPQAEPQVFDTSNDVVTALNQGQVDAVVVDTPTAYFLTATQIKGASIVGQFSAPGGDQWGALLQKDSSLTDCVSAAVDDLQQSGELDKIEERWIGGEQGVPTLE
jgi:polar amino acid transport system substrate-binding protein